MGNIMPFGGPSVGNSLWLEPIPSELREAAVNNLNSGDVIGFLGCASNGAGLQLVYDNTDALEDRGLYEAALVHAFVSTSTNHYHWPVEGLRHMFQYGDRQRLRAAGDPLPGPGPYTLYRGVAGRGPARRVRGLSWTADPIKAQWFAERFKSQFEDPRVFEITVAEEHVFVYYNGRGEQEFIVDLPPEIKPSRLEAGS